MHFFFFALYYIYNQRNFVLSVSMLSVFSGLCFVFLSTFELWSFRDCLPRNVNI